MQDLLVNTPASHVDYEDLREAVAAIKGVADHLNESKRQKDAYNQLASVLKCVHVTHVIGF